jgi:Family of unknown function (DUF6187)
VSEYADSRFALPGVDAPAGTEVGVILLGLEADRLLAGLGLARLADDPALVTQAVDQARHGVAGFTLSGLVAGGAEHWRSLRRALEFPPRPNPGSHRQEWTRAAERVAAALPDAGPATIAYLTACALRRGDVDELADAPIETEDPFDVLPEVPAG